MSNMELSGLEQRIMRALKDESQNADELRYRFGLTNTWKEINQAIANLISLSMITGDSSAPIKYSVIGKGEL